MIKRTLILLLLLSVICAYSQINMIVTAPNSKCMLDCKIQITFTNVTKKDYIIPIDTLGLRAYDQNLFWLDFNHSESVDKSLSLELLLKKNRSNEFLEATTRKKDMDIGQLDSLLLIIKGENDKYKEKINNWKLRYKIKDSKMAEKNMYIIENLLLLKSGQQFSFYVNFDTSFDFENNHSTSESYYSIEPDTKFNAILKLKIPFNITSYLTSEQIKKYEKYKIFTGDIISRPFQLVLENDKYLLTN